MKLLVLGGTIFVGRHIVETALARGHEVTLFNRGVTAPHLFVELEHLRGDRDGGLDALKGRTWDAVIDTSGELPQWVWDSALLLSNSAHFYALLSSILVYPNFTQHGLDETCAVDALLPGENPDEMSHATFGALKALCELAAETHFPGRTLVARAGLPVGPYDFTDRMSYWPRRVADGGEVLAPGRPDRPLQFIDARDLAAWMVRMVEDGRAGLFNAVGPEDVLTLKAFLDTCRSVTGSDATFTWADDDFLLAQGVRPLYDLPLWIPEEESGLYTIANRRAVSAGLAFRPLSETLRDVLPKGTPGRINGRENGSKRRRGGGETGLDRQREAELLQAWHRQRH